MNSTKPQAIRSRIARLAAASLVLALFSHSAYALEAQSMCFASASQRYHIDPLLLRAIAEVESSLSNDAVHVNRDGSKDFGLMQVNDRNLTDTQRARVKADPCFAIEKGAQVLAGMIARLGYNWRAVGAYNAGTLLSRKKRREQYATKVWAHYRMLVDRRRAQLMEVEYGG